MGLDYLCGDSCEATRALVFWINVGMLVLTVVRNNYLFKIELLRGIEFFHAQESSPSILGTRFVLSLVLELLVLVPVVTPKSVLNLEELQYYSIMWGQGVGHRELHFTLVSFIVLFFVLVRLSLVARVLP